MDDALARIETHAREYAAEAFEKLGADETALLYAYRCAVRPKSARRGTTPTSGTASSNG